jgi:DNA-binding transcriptional regulator YdaS (Cro superfamily)
MAKRKPIDYLARRRIAQLCGVHEGSLYQAMTGKGCGFSPQQCVRIEQQTNKELRRWDLRPRDWWLIWPELINRKGAPPIPKNPGRGPLQADAEESAAAAQ